jgi:(1->4)-alpha-D-glucan 1-alpha-D-glucosylmutase
MTSLIDAALTGARAGAFFAAFLPFARRVAVAGAHNSLVQTVLKLTAPGVPDIYNGTELWDLSMVDPDNRRPVDYALRARMLDQIEAGLAADRSACLRQLWQHWHDGRIKLATIATLLQHRREVPDLYTEGDYQPLPALGAHAEELCAFARTHGPQVLIVAVARGSRRRQQPDFVDDTMVNVPEALHRRQWRELLTGRALQLASGQFRAAELFADLPVAVLAQAPVGD